MKITALETLRTDEFSNILWFRVHTDAGLIGLGEPFYGAGAVEAHIHDTLSERLWAAILCGSSSSTKRCSICRWRSHPPAPSTGPPRLSTLRYGICSVSSAGNRFISCLGGFAPRKCVSITLVPDIVTFARGISAPSRPGTFQTRKGPT